jgi:maleylpyruvate isomerase
MVRSWMEDNTKLFLTCLDRLADAELDAPSTLPGWSRRHLVAHVHYNAQALRRLVRWAATGEEAPMYGSPEQRASEIEEGSTLPAAELRLMVVDSARTLSQELDALTPTARRHQVVTAQGRTVAATEIPWMRTREVAVHAVDLRAGASFTDFPDEMTAELLVDVVRRRVSRGEGSDLAAWLTGRVGDPPRLGSWL